MDASFHRIWRRFRGDGLLRPAVCLTASVASGLILAGLGMFGGWLFGMFRPAAFGRVVGDVLARHITTGMSIAGGVWILVLVWLWRPAVRLRRPGRSGRGAAAWSRALLIMAGIGAGVTVVSYAIQRQPWDDTHFAVTGLTLVAGGVVVAVWLPAVFGLEQGRRMRGSLGQVDVRCPACGYAMSGLKCTSCPECGTTYTLDRLILAQGYETTEE
ncbi:MAG: hypothetical protein HKO59_14275 [Phycisphaerales bacterium]|nr:hypothetical protein [Phycisphaerae bacterium]NNF43921.1 hypothetical protein [Phycisphaerales bacterium]NNM27126.1 hypothetical protein [Phycisphaerales bacterium]